MRRAVAFATFALSLTAAALASATVSQPNGTVVPTPKVYCASGSPGGLEAIFACACTTAGVCNVGAPCPGGGPTTCDQGTNGTCEGRLWHDYNDNSCIPSNYQGLDVQAEAATTPETFRPTCALTFTILSRGTAQFQNIFGWYNVTGSVPAASDLHPMFGCADGAGKAVVLDLSSEPSYKGGDIGFFLLTPESHTTKTQCASGNCCPSLARLASGEGYVYYSQKTFNPDTAGAGSTIHLLTYNSHLSKTKFYFAWEDIFGGNDDEFTDLVTSVDGVQCSGGGQQCDTGKPGICALGVTQCSAGAVSCTGVFAPKAEACNGLDDDCNGKVDDGATCPTAGDQCVNGRCVPPCSTGEFQCDPGKVCDSNSGLCVDPTCLNKTCPSAQVCRNGSCVTPCDGVVCPYGTRCVGDACVDLCASVKCSAGQVCREGICFDGCASCSGVSCGSGLKCDAPSGDCVDPSCTTSCAKGTHCASGSCVDDCAGAKCPDGSTCTAGACVLSGAADAGVNLGDAGGLGGDASASSDGATSGAAPAAAPAASACGCDVVGSTAGVAGWWAIAAGAIAMMARRRRG